MDYLDLIKHRKSYRDFKKRWVPQSAVDELQEFFKNTPRLMPQLKMEMVVVTGNAGERLQGVCGHQGIAYNAPAYMIFFSEEDHDEDEEDDMFYVNAGYVAEHVVLKAEDMGLSTCWLSASHSDMIKFVLNLEDNPLTVAAVIALGYGLDVVAKGSIRLTIANESHIKLDSRKYQYVPKISQEELVFHTNWGNAVDWEGDYIDPRLDDALYAASLSPCAMNHQQYRYAFYKDTILLLSARDPLLTPAEGWLGLGITMLHFAVIAQRYYNSSWKLGIPEEMKAFKKPKGYRRIAYFPLWNADTRTENSIRD